MSVGKLKITAARLVGVVLAGVVLAGLSLARVAHADSGPSTITDNVVQINETISPEGFKHPGIRFTKESLENLRTQVIAGQEPWASYYEGMRRRHWASLDYGPRNHDGNGYPAHDVISHNGLIAGFIDDAQAALMHSVQYVVTGDERHREKAMYLVGVYSHMNPNGVEYFADAHIKMGQPIYHMTAAAEILRATSTTRPELEWTEEMTYNYVHNFLQPQADAYIRKNHYFMNQYSYALIGNVASAIFADDRAAYEEAVEWATVGSTAENQGWVGSIERQLRLVTQNDQTGEPLEEPHIQLVEMGRDQAHAIGNVDSLFIISQIIASQDTKVDPVTGTVSPASDAIDPVHFSDDALRKAYIQFAKYNLGFDIPWVPVASSILADGSIDSLYRWPRTAYRGRLRANAFPAMYYFYKYMADGYDLTEGDNRFIQMIYEKSMEHSWRGVRSGGYWGPREHVYDSEFWMHLPASVADTSVPPRGEPREVLDELPPGGPWHIKEVEKKEIVMGGSVQEKTEGEVSYLSVDTTTAEPAVFALWSVWFSDSVNAFRVRSDGPATIEFARGRDLPASTQLHVPDTGGEWRYIPFDTSKRDTWGSGNLRYIRVIGGSITTVVDIDHVNTSEDTLTPPVFDTLSTDILTYAGGELDRSFAAAAEAGSLPFYFTEGMVPASAMLDSSTGRFNWAPASGDEGEYRFHVVAEDGEYMASHQVTITVTASAEAAVELVAEAMEPGVAYESSGREAFHAAHTAALDAIQAGGSLAEIDMAIARFQVAARALQPLNPVIPEESANDELGPEANGVRLDYPSIVDSANTWLGALVDGNSGSANSRWGDEPYVLLDFGASFRVVTEAVHIHPRQAFPDRTRGTHVLASDDGVNWVRITDNMGYGDRMHRLPVYEEFRNRAFRYLKFYTDPGVCDCPVLDFGEIYIFGERKEVIADLASAPPRWFVGETLEIPVAVTPTQDDPVEFSADLPAGAVFDQARGLITWTPDAGQVGDQVLTIRADFGYAQVEDSLPITVSASADAAVDELLESLGGPESYTEASLTMLARAEADARLITSNPDEAIEDRQEAIALFEQAMELVEPVHTGDDIDVGRFAGILASHSQRGAPEIDESLAGVPAFDGDTSTIVNLEAASGTWVQADFGEDRYVSLTRVRLTPRWDYGRRLNNAVIEGSNDGENWTRLAKVPYDEYLQATWDNHVTTLEVSDATAYRYVRFVGHNGTYGNVAEVELFGSGDYALDDLTLRYLQLKASTLDAALWDDASWQRLQDALAQAEKASGIYAVTAATAALEKALNSLVPPSGNLSFEDVPERWFANELLEFSIFPNGVADEGVYVTAELPDGATFDPVTGLVSWAMNSDQLGRQELRFVVSFDYTPTRLQVSLPVTVFADASAAVDEILATAGSLDQYTQFSVDMLARAEAEARDIAADPNMTVQQKLESIALFELAMELIEPKHTGDEIDTERFAVILASHSQRGAPEIDESLAGVPAFDGETSTIVNLEAASGTWVQADFGEDRYVSLTRVRLTPRWDYGRRLNHAAIEGSNDGENWTRLAKVPYDEYLNATWDNHVTTLEVSDTTAYRYVRFVGRNGSYGNVAEIELFGTGDYAHDDVTLRYLQLKASTLDAALWDDASWQRLQDALAQAETASGIYAAYAVPAATAALEKALNSLVPASGNLSFDGVPERWFVDEPLEFSIFPEGVADEGVFVTAELPDGATFDPVTGLVSWALNSDQLGRQELRFVVSFDYTPVRFQVSLPVTVFADASAAVDEILATAGSLDQYTQFSVDMLARAESEVREIAADPAVSPYRKLSYLDLLEQAITLLEPFDDTIDVAGEASILASHHRWGTPERDVTLSGLPAFDGEQSTYVDMQSPNGTWVQADFGEGRHVSLTRVRFTPRWDYGRRLNNAAIEGSNDGESWTRLARVPHDEYLQATWDNHVITLEVSDDTAYRYVRFVGSNGSHGNVAEIELFGTHNDDYDDRILPYLMAKAGILVENDWTADSWQYLMDVLAVARAMIEEGGSDEALYADATAMLDEALNTLVPAPSYLDFIVADVQANEADGSITLLVDRTGGTLGVVSADFATLDGSASASAGEDFVDTNGTLTWADGDMDPKAVVVSLVNDGYLEDEEDFTVKLETADNGVIGDSGEAQVTLIDDDPDALPGLSIADASLVEGDGKLPSAAPMQFEVPLSGTARQPAMPGLSFGGVSLVEGNGKLPFAASKQFEIPLSGTARQPAMAGLWFGGVFLDEGDGKLLSATSMQFKVSLSGTARQPAKVLVYTRRGTAKNGRDFIPLGRVVHFAVDEKSKVVEVWVRPDNKREDDEQFTLEAKWAKGAEIQDGVGVGTILDDD